ncbi:MAG: outer membrane protein assembly factor BamA [bacterium]|nr:outer membrane protein assembly factor BamA [bacterium]
MKHRIAVLLFILLNIQILFAQVLFAQENEITDILIQGNNSVATATIFSLIHSQIGDKYNLTTVDNDLKAIYNSGYFSDVSIDLKKEEHGLTLLFIVKEKPLISKIKFAGNKELKEDDLKKEITLKTGIPISQKDIRESIEKLTVLAKDNGHYFAKIDSKIEDEGKTVTFLIDEGKKIKIKELTLIGNNVFSAFKLKWKMTTSTGDFYKETQLQEDIEKLLFFYKTNGYPMVSIQKPGVVYDKEKDGIIININIEEGNLFKIKEINFSGNTIFKTEELKKMLTTKSGDSYSVKSIALDRNKIMDAYFEQGYVTTSVIPDAEFETKEATADIIYKIKEGGKSYLEKISVCGNTTTKEKVILRELLFKEGEMFDGKKVKQSRQRLINLGFFEQVKFDIRPGSEETKKVLDIEVKEGKTGNLIFSAAYGNKPGLFGTIEFTKKNLFGKGYSSSIKTEFGKNLLNYEFGFTDPWFRDTPTSVGFDIWRTTEKEDEYTDKKRGGAIRIGRPLGSHNNIYFKYKYDKSAMVNVKADAPDSIIEWRDKWGDGNYVLSSSLAVRFVRNTKKGEEILFHPTAGYQIELSNEFAGGFLGGDVDFYKPTFEGSWYIPSWWEFVLALHTKLGLVTNLAKHEDIPDYEKFRIGGPYSVRGYNDRSIRPDSGGGESMLIGNVEYRFPIGKELFGCLFADVGNVWEKASKITSFGDLKYGTGFGLRFKSPIGPIRLDYAWGLSDAPGHQKGTPEIHISFGSFF